MPKHKQKVLLKLMSLPESDDDLRNLILSRKGKMKLDEKEGVVITTTAKSAAKKKSAKGHKDKSNQANLHSKREGSKDSQDKKKTIQRSKSPSNHQLTEDIAVAHCGAIDCTCVKCTNKLKRSPKCISCRKSKLKSSPPVTPENQSPTAAPSHKGVSLRGTQSKRSLKKSSKSPPKTSRKSSKSPPKTSRKSSKSPPKKSSKSSTRKSKKNLTSSSRGSKISAKTSPRKSRKSRSKCSGHSLVSPSKNSTVGSKKKTSKVRGASSKKRSSSRLKSSSSCCGGKIDKKSGMDPELKRKRKKIIKELLEKDQIIVKVENGCKMYYSKDGRLLLKRRCKPVSGPIAPQRPLHIKTNGNNAVSVRWSEPPYPHSLTINNYKVEMMVLNSGGWELVDVVKEPEIIIDGFNKSNKYLIRVISITHDNQESLPLTNNCPLGGTKQDVIVASEVTNNQLKLSWNKFKTDVDGRTSAADRKTNRSNKSNLKRSTKPNPANKFFAKCCSKHTVICCMGLNECNNSPNVYKNDTSLSQNIYKELGILNETKVEDGSIDQITRNNQTNFLDVWACNDLFYNIISKIQQHSKKKKIAVDQKILTTTNNDFKKSAKATTSSKETKKSPEKKSIKFSKRDSIIQMKTPLQNSINYKSDSITSRSKSREPKKQSKEKLKKNSTTSFIKEPQKSRTFKKKSKNLPKSDSITSIKSKSRKSNKYSKKKSKKSSLEVLENGKKSKNRKSTISKQHSTTLLKSRSSTNVNQPFNAITPITSKNKYKNDSNNFFQNYISSLIKSEQPKLKTLPQSDLITTTHPFPKESKNNVKDLLNMTTKHISLIPIALILEETNTSNKMDSMKPFKSDSTTLIRSKTRKTKKSYKKNSKNLLIEPPKSYYSNTSVTEEPRKTKTSKTDSIKLPNNKSDSSTLRISIQKESKKSKIKSKTPSTESAETYYSTTSVIKEPQKSGTSKRDPSKLSKSDITDPSTSITLIPPETKKSSKKKSKKRSKESSKTYYLTTSVIKTPQKSRTSKRDPSKLSRSDITDPSTSITSIPPESKKSSKIKSKKRSKESATSVLKEPQKSGTSKRVSRKLRKSDKSDSITLIPQEPKKSSEIKTKKDLLKSSRQYDLTSTFKEKVSDTELSKSSLEMFTKSDSITLIPSSIQETSNFPDKDLMKPSKSKSENDSKGIFKSNLCSKLKKLRMVCKCKLVSTESLELINSKKKSISLFKFDPISSTTPQKYLATESKKSFLNKSSEQQPKVSDESKIYINESLKKKSVEGNRETKFDNYVIEQMDVVEGIWAKIGYVSADMPFPEYRVTNLQPCTKYIFKISADKPGWPNIFSQKVIKTCSDPKYF